MVAAFMKWAWPDRQGYEEQKLQEST
jgi:hypothetical protein